MAHSQNAPPIKVPKRATPPDAVPRRINSPNLDDHLAVITRAIFQAGLSWAFIASRWTAFCAAFDNFAIDRVARYDGKDIARLLATDGLVRSEKKFVATVANARTLLALSDEFGSIERYITSFASYAAILADARSRLRFLGDLSCYYWLFRTGHAVPPFETWIANAPKDHPRMREMVMMGRAEGTSSETAAVQPVK